MAGGELQLRVGRNLREHRRRLGLSQEAFAEELDIHRTYMGGVERGERNITLLTLERIAEKLGVDPSELTRPEQQTPEDDSAAAEDPSR